MKYEIFDLIIDYCKIKQKTVVYSIIFITILAIIIVIIMIIITIVQNTAVADGLDYVRTCIASTRRIAISGALVWRLDEGRALLPSQNECSRLRRTRLKLFVYYFRGHTFFSALERVWSRNVITMDIIDIVFFLFEYVCN
jgi:hypothetical protein